MLFGTSFFLCFPWCRQSIFSVVIRCFSWKAWVSIAVTVLSILSHICYTSPNAILKWSLHLQHQHNPFHCSLCFSKFVFTVNVVLCIAYVRTRRKVLKTLAFHVNLIRPRQSNSSTYFCLLVFQCQVFSMMVTHLIAVRLSNKQFENWLVIQFQFE